MMVNTMVNIYRCFPTWLVLLFSWVSSCSAPARSRGLLRITYELQKPDDRPVESTLSCWPCLLSPNIFHCWNGDVYVFFWCWSLSPLIWITQYTLVNLKVATPPYVSICNWFTGLPIKTGDFFSFQVSQSWKRPPRGIQSILKSLTPISDLGFAVGTVNRTVTGLARCVLRGWG